MTWNWTTPSNLALWATSAREWRIFTKVTCIRMATSRAPTVWSMHAGSWRYSTRDLDCNSKALLPQEVQDCEDDALVILNMCWIAYVMHYIYATSTYSGVYRYCACFFVLSNLNMVTLLIHSMWYHKTASSSLCQQYFGRSQTMDCRAFWLDKHIKKMKKPSTNVMLPSMKIFWTCSPSTLLLSVTTSSTHTHFIGPCRGAFYRQAVDSTRDPERELPTSQRHPEGWCLQLCHHRLWNNAEGRTLQLWHYDCKRLWQVLSFFSFTIHVNKYQNCFRTKYDFQWRWMHRCCESSPQQWEHPFPSYPAWQNGYPTNERADNKVLGRISGCSTLFYHNLVSCAEDVRWTVREQFWLSFGEKKSNKPLHETNS